jgi:hypothetical protein
MFQKDYWKLSDEKLERLAKKYRISTDVLVLNGSMAVFSREKTISGLLVRENARRAKLTTAIAILALLLSLAGSGSFTSFNTQLNCSGRSIA